MVSRTVTVRNQLGMHARAAARFVHTASGFESIMGVLLLAAARGSFISITVEGADEEAALEALCQLVESGFGEEPCTA